MSAPPGKTGSVSDVPSGVHHTSQLRMNLFTASSVPMYFCAKVHSSTSTIRSAMSSRARYIEARASHARERMVLITMHGLQEAHERRLYDLQAFRIAGHLEKPRTRIVDG